jgi:hypothetical protein
MLLINLDSGQDETYDLEDTDFMHFSAECRTHFRETVVQINVLTTMFDRIGSTTYFVIIEHVCEAIVASPSGQN